MLPIMTYFWELVSWRERGLLFAHKTHQRLAGDTGHFSSVFWRSHIQLDVICTVFSLIFVST